jgi:hypothetical protein
MSANEEHAGPTTVQPPLTRRARLSLKRLLELRLAPTAA